MSIINKEQRAASNPECSVWLSASAGTGKTKVLTDRVLLMLLNKIEAKKILCITFTNAAAIEMRQRIYNKVSKWAFSKAGDLQDELESLIGSPASHEQTIVARGLLEQELKNFDSLNIYTIHSFCQKTLKQFSMEAGVGANFKIIDEINQQQILSNIRYSIISDPALKELNYELLSQMHATKFNELIDNILAQRIDFLQLFSAFSDKQGYVNDLKRRFNIEELPAILQQSTQQLAQIAPRIKIDSIKNKINTFSLSSLMQDFEALVDIFLTQTHQKRQKIIDKKTQQTYPCQLSLLLEVQEIVAQGLDKINISKLLDSSLLLYQLARAVIEKYEGYKKSHNFLDYDDLIYYTCQLFTKSEFKDWILYKLDGGIQHILVDEAQDTNSEQWQLILAMISDFIAGESAKSSKSIFIVGDQKQSIYSFQGARFEQFEQVKTQVLQSLASAQKKYQSINLSTSYRSSALILDVVDKIFSHVRSLDQHLFSADNFALQCHFKDYGGTVQLWPLYCDDEKEQVFWPILSTNDKLSKEQRLAKDIANYIKNTLESKKVLFSTQKPVQAEDFMILLRQRNTFASVLIDELEQLNLPISGLDRIDLFDDLAVLDLLAAARFSIFPDDELNLASLLKSPIFNLSDADLYKLLYNRQEKLYEVIHKTLEYSSIHLKLQAICDLARNASINQFFYCLVFTQNNLVNFLSQSPNSLDSINELISLAVKFEQEVSSNMHEFLTWCANCHMELKRDINSGDVIRIMTIHAAKGLQAPIVILPDTTGMPTLQQQFLWHQDNMHPQAALFCLKADEQPSIYHNVKSTENNKQYLEYLRLLYVATTRACEELIFCGIAHSQKIDAKCWYSLVKDAIEPQMHKVKTGDFEFLQLTAKAKRPIAKTLPIPTQSLPLVNLNLDAISALSTKQITLTANSPLNETAATFYGQIVHKIFEDGLKNKDTSLLFSHDLLAILPEEYRIKLTHALEQLLQNRQFLQLLKCELKTEVSINCQQTLGRIDLLAIDGNKITIIDYKTDHQMPQTQLEVPEKYLNQINTYHQAISSIYPSAVVDMQILWIMHAQFMQIKI